MSNRNPRPPMTPEDRRQPMQTRRLNVYGWIRLPEEV